ncbi:MAG: anti-sigma factor [Actinomycetota bacterium]
MRRRHEEIRELLGAYALDSVDDAERLELERHLEGCATCREEVAEHREVAALVSGPEERPPDHVWARIRAQLGEPRSERASMTEIHRPGPVARRVAAALTAVAMVAVGFLGWRVAVLEDRIDRLGGETLAAAAEGVLADPDAERLVLRSEDASLAVDVVVLPEGTGYVLQHNLEPVPEDRTYQLWAMVGERPVSAGLLGADPAITPFRVGDGTVALAITVERSGGAQRPTSDPIVLGRLS